MPRITRPMLAASIKDIAKLQYPLIATPKIDGIRCLKLNGDIVSRSLKPIQNQYIHSSLKAMLPEGADGEIVVGSTFHETSSAVMSQAGEPEFTYAIFDLVYDINEPYEKRLALLDKYISAIGDCPMAKVPYTHIRNEKALLRYETQMLEKGFEGVMLRRPDSPYKCGRSTFNEGYLLKLKRFEDAEAVIVDFEEAMHNTNEAVTNELGYMERSSAKDGKVPVGRLGAFVVRDIATGIVFNVGNGEGLTIAMRQEIWRDRTGYLGRTIKYRYQPVGTKESPRFPQFLGFRDEW